MKSSFISSIIGILKVLYLVHNAIAEPLQLTSENFDKTIGENEYVFINFYADWCHFSQMLTPIWVKLAEEVKKSFPDSKIVIAKLDAEHEKPLAARFQVSKYPTMKLFHDGQPLKKEYRGKREVSSFVNYLKDEMVDPVIKIESLDAIKKKVGDKMFIIGQFESSDSKVYQVFKKVSSRLKSDCHFLSKFGSSDLPEGLKNSIHYQEKVGSEKVLFQQNLEVFDEVNIWANNLCIPPVRKITFDNAEALTEEGLPFMILFHHPDDKETLEKFTNVVKNHLVAEKQKVNFLYADGKVFEHPLRHLGKSEEHLPLIAIDSFRHMYLFPDMAQMEKPEKLKKFINDLQSGKLHREYHYGPDPDDDDDYDNDDEDKAPKPTLPPESTFAKLKPSKNRYSFQQKDEF